MARQYTDQQRKVIEHTQGNMLVSASAGTGKTTVMVERLCGLLQRGAVDISNIAVVTFTNLAAADMKRRLAEQLAEYRHIGNVAEQLEKLDMSAISTIHSLCADILRNYFYVVDIDPSFVILDEITLKSLQDKAMKEVLKQYSQNQDQVYNQLYQIFMRGRKEDALREQIAKLYEFSRNKPDFEQWYNATRQNFLDFGKDNQLLQVLNNDLSGAMCYYREQYLQLADKLIVVNMQQYAKDICQFNADLLAIAPNNTFNDNLEIAVNAVVGLQKNIRKNTKASLCPDTPEDVFEAMRARLDSLHKQATTKLSQYTQFVLDSNLQQLLDQTKATVPLVDKLVEVTLEYARLLNSYKKSYGGLDFADLEHLTLAVLNDEQAIKQLHDKYRLVFVDEYQDINGVQEAIISKLSQGDRLFVVGDVKQSIYGFRGCDPTLFASKQQQYTDNNSGEVVLLNDNFRSNKNILDFVNVVCNKLMTMDFGGVDYLNTAQLSGKSTDSAPFAPVELCFVEQTKADKEQATGIYDITQPIPDSIASIDAQCDAVVSYVKQFVGSTITTKDGSHTVGYGDIVVLTRSMTNKSLALYNKLISANIPVVADFKSQGISNKEVRDIINLLRVVDNPYNDVPFVGVCLSHFGGLDEQQLSIVRCWDNSKYVDSSNKSFVKHCQNYFEHNDNAISHKLSKLFQLIDDLRFFGYGTGVDGVILRLLTLTRYHLYVESLPNGHLRISNLYAFVNGIKGKHYAQSIDKFLRYVDESGTVDGGGGASGGNAVTIMTMHGSKGLEFPIVIMPFVDSTFRFDKVLVNTNDNLGIAINYYDFEEHTTTDSLSKFAIDMLNKRKQRQEELRLLYVALTRPKNHLVIVGEYNKHYFDNSITDILPQYATSLADYIFGAYIASNNGNLQCGRMADGVSVKIYNEQHTQQTTIPDNLLCQQRTDIDNIVSALQYNYQYAQQAELPAKVVSSQLDSIILAKDNPQPPQRALVDDDRPKIGTAYHKVYECVDFNSDKLGIASTIELLVDSGDIDRDIADKLDLQLIQSTLCNNQLRDIMNEGKVYHELPFMLNVSANKVLDSNLDEHIILQGVLDMLVLNKDSATVVDFKYTSSTKNLKQRYKKQIDSYRLAVQEICGISASKVQCYIFSISDNKLFKL